MKEATLHYIDPFSLLIVDENGILKRIFCPFTVISMDSTKERTVEMVRKNPDNEILYIINGVQHPHGIFRIE